MDDKYWFSFRVPERLRGGVSVCTLGFGWMCVCMCVSRIPTKIEFGGHDGENLLACQLTIFCFFY